MLKVMSVIVPILVLLLIVLPLVKVFKGKVSALSAKRRIILHVVMFFTLLVGVTVAAPIAFAAGEEAAQAASDSGMAKGLGYLAAAIATGLSALGAGIAVAAAAPAAIGAISENPKNFGKSLIFVALGEGVAIYGLLISILILNTL
ncbi:cation exporting V-type ATPase, subunit K [Alteracholeplasma palmae J233]|uniref:ATP synthase F(0) sector subunit c n=1 Tax=Alteracholeplasma palmae (strain ATCC 49389 / J233) TaxID=1318466 RepID=U4KRB1_ALTPJ|nr:ATP synthase subunit C [Alteracholeplasma palmae]CCV64006.1 cation exporting V-type ATPase, subunit K [Alteracholeplasma palmae J233]